MILGFLGKGGSGKSTLATATVRYLHAKGDIVLALDADYNMDLSHNLLVPETILHFGTEAKKDMKKYLHVDATTTFSDIVIQKKEEQFFSLNPIDTFTKTYTLELQPKLLAMSVGPHTDEVLTEKVCSHGLGALLKVYLPLLKLEKNQHVIVDEKAGTDSVGTGIPTGFDVVVIVCEPTIYGLKAGKQIAVLLDYFKTPYVFVLNKIKGSTNILEIEKELGENVLVSIPFGESIADTYIEQIVRYVDIYRETYGDNRLERSVAKFVYNKNI